jgi:uncharacterized protein YqjF (DUF2071 family)
LRPTLEQRLAERERPDHAAFGFQRWDHLLFLHWAYDAAAIQRTLPPGLTVDTHEGRAYLGVVPFYMRRIRPPFLPPVPWLSYFLELNLRTYVHDAAGRPGIWFYSLDCNRALAVWVARWRFHLPYQHATLGARVDGDRVDYTIRRRGDDHTGRYTYRPTGEARPADPGTLEFFLAERYRLFARHREGRLLTAHVHHPPYPLAPAEVTAHDSRVVELAGFDAPGRPPDHALYARRVDVTVFRIHDLVLSP